MHIKALQNRRGRGVVAVARLRGMKDAGSGSQQRCGRARHRTDGGRARSEADRKAGAGRR